MSAFKLVMNGGRMVEDVESLVLMTESISKENGILKHVIERQGALLTNILDEIGVVSRKMDEMWDDVMASRQTAHELKHTKFYGQTAELLGSAMEKAKELSNKEIRKLLRRAAKTHPSGMQKGYTEIYNKLAEITGFNVYDYGKITLKKSDGIEGWSKDPSYVNTVIKYGKQQEAAVICMQIVADTSAI